MITRGTNNINTDNCNTTAVLNGITGNPVSCASTITGTPTAPKAVGTLLAIKLTNAENTGRNPRLIKIAAGIATAVPNPAIPSNNPPNPHVINNTCTLLSVEIEENCCFNTSIFFVCNRTL